MGEWEAWLKAGTGDDKTDIVVIADFYQRTGGLFSRDKDHFQQREFCSIWRIRRSQRERTWPSARPTFDSQVVFQREHSDAAFGS